MWGHSHGYLGCPRFSRKENLMGEAGMGAYLEAGIQLMICSCKMRVWNRCFSNQKLNASPLGKGKFTVFPIVLKAYFLQDLVNTCQFFESVRWPTHLEQILWSTVRRMDSLRQGSATLSNRALRAAFHLFKTRTRPRERISVTAWWCQAAEVNCARHWVLEMPPYCFHSSENALALRFGCCPSLWSGSRPRTLLFGLDSLWLSCAHFTC